MEISLIRHGKSKHFDDNRMTCEEFKSWVKKYDDCGVFEENFYPTTTLQKVESVNLVVTSNLKRSIESAKLLNLP